MDTKRSILFVLVCTFIAVPSMADYYAGTANVGTTPGYSTVPGGEFTISNTSLNISAYAGVATLGANSFQSFCLELGEYTSNPSDVVVSTTFINEGTGVVTGAGSHAVEGGMGIGNNLNAETAFLYTMFATGQLGYINLGGYNYDYTAGDGRRASAGSLQNAIWAIESPVYTTADVVALAWKTAAEAAVAVGGVWEGKGIGDVRVLNMYIGGTYGPATGTGELAQDMMYLVPVPGAVLLGMLGLGYASMKLRKRA